MLEKRCVTATKMPFLLSIILVIELKLYFFQFALDCHCYGGHQADEGNRGLGAGPEDEADGGQPDLSLLGTVTWPPS